MSEYQFFDSHCHIDFSEFDTNRGLLLQQAYDVGINKLLVPGISLAQSSQLLESKLAEDIFINTGVSLYFALGLHPYFLAEHQTNHINALEQLYLSNKQKIYAIGECGIDSSIENIETQKQLFSSHISLANKYQLPLIVHHRQSHHLIAQVFKQNPPRYGGIIHAFSGSLQQASAYIKLGFKIGVGGVITYDRAQKTRASISQLPLESLLLETDAPSMPVSGKQGEINTPMALLSVFENLASIRPENKEVIAEQILKNSLEVFKLE